MARRALARWTAVGNPGGDSSLESAAAKESPLQRQSAEYLWLRPLALGGNRNELLAFLHMDSLRHRRATHTAQPQPARLPVKQQTMRSMWESPRIHHERVVEDDWLDWMRHLSVEMLRESPSPALRACAPVAQMHEPLAQRLFNVAFMVCWGVLEPSSRDSLVAAIEQALTAPTAPSEVLQGLLGLAEYMERHDQQLPLNLRMLGDIATRCGSYSKALHYRELEYQALTGTTSSSPRLVEALVSLHRSLGQPEAAIGVLTHAQQQQDFKVKVSWLEKLGRWQDALTAYERAQLAEPRAGEFVVGRLRCLHALSEWQQLTRVCEAAWVSITGAQQKEAAPLLAAARWHCQHWAGLRRAVALIESSSYDGAFFRAILAVNGSTMEGATQWIETARNALQVELTPLANESYSRVYENLIKAQQLSELEELVEFKTLRHIVLQAEDADSSGQNSRSEISSDVAARARETCDSIRDRWLARLRVCASELRVWQPMVELRAMALEPHEQRKTWIKFASLCRKSGRLELTRSSLSKLLPRDGPLSTLPVHQLASSSFGGLMAACPAELLYAYSKYLWGSGEQPAAIELLKRLLERDAHEPPYPSPSQMRQYRGISLDRDVSFDLASEEEDELGPMYHPGTRTFHNGGAPLHDAASLARSAAAARAGAALNGVVIFNATADGEPPSAPADSMPTRKDEADDQAAQGSGRATPQASSEAAPSKANAHRRVMDDELCMRAYLHLGEWQLQVGQASAGGLDDETISTVLDCYQHATRYDASSYKAWHAWALMNFKAISRTQDQVSVGPTTSRSNGGANTCASADGGDAFSSGQVSPPLTRTDSQGRP